MRYRRSVVAGGTYFFTANLAIRSGDILAKHVELLRNAFRAVLIKYPFDIVAMVVLPDHLHAVWRLPPDDCDYPLRWSLIKSHFSRSLPKVERTCDARRNKRERGIWQRRYWEHQIRDDRDLQTHVDYISLQSGQARLRRQCGGLATFVHPSIHRLGPVAAPLGTKS